jgi:membrane protein required for beta-lactamase induction
MLNNRLETVGCTLGDVRGLAQILLRHREQSHGRSSAEFLITVVPFAGLWFLMWLSLNIQYGLVLLLTAGFLVRLFMIQRGDIDTMTVNKYLSRSRGKACAIAFTGIRW